MNQSRRPQGTPTGGQFAATARSESGVLLGANQAEGEDGETLVRDFCCETHDESGECTQECADLVSQMDTSDFDPNWAYDPTGCSNGPERPYRTYEYDAQTRASICVTHVPEGEALVRALQPGQWVYVDGEPRKVDSVAAPVRYRPDTFVDFESYDREPDGSPSAYLSRKFRLDDTLAVVRPEDVPKG